ncbi:circadian clock protein KaiB [Colwellia sp. PAMC 20917]|uniref:circadian clock protein KaiB n=1 Tax=Colwellia sp. PAMC 20917 TaxID=1816218 RepID=UPI000878658E|nr:circadian clock protein KaiB [Colwellia sp. PAMC 20917]AOW77838.1 circadian clock protein KaiB [Colwellia sp. PAMC 20917]
MKTFALKLYITGKTARSELAIHNLTRICEDELYGDYVIDVIDVMEHPQLAEEQKIVATPTLVKVLPEPLRRVIGDMSESEKVLLGLDIVIVKNDNIIKKEVES